MKHKINWFHFWFPQGMTLQKLEVMTTKTVGREDAIRECWNQIWGSMCWRHAIFIVGCLFVCLIRLVIRKKQGNWTPTMVWVNPEICKEACMSTNLPWEKKEITSFSDHLFLVFMNWLRRLCYLGIFLFNYFKWFPPLCLRNTSHFKNCWKNIWNRKWFFIMRYFS